MSNTKYPKGPSWRRRTPGKPFWSMRRSLIRGEIQAPADAGGKTDHWEFQVKYQTCDDRGNCLPPKTLKLPGHCRSSKPARKSSRSIRSIRHDEEHDEEVAGRLTHQGRWGAFGRFGPTTLLRGKKTSSRHIFLSHYIFFRLPTQKQEAYPARRLSSASAERTSFDRRSPSSPRSFSTTKDGGRMRSTLLAGMSAARAAGLRLPVDQLDGEKKKGSRTGGRPRTSRFAKSPGPSGGRKKGLRTTNPASRGTTGQARQSERQRRFLQDGGGMGSSRQSTGSGPQFRRGDEGLLNRRCRSIRTTPMLITPLRNHGGHCGQEYCTARDHYECRAATETA